MKKSTILVVAIWAVVVGGNIVNVLIFPSRAFVDGPQLPWQVVFLPIVVVVGAFFRRELMIGAQVDWLFGPGSYRKFMKTLRLELLFAVMCLGIVLGGLARAYLFNAPAFPLVILGFFASGAGAFLLAYFIRRIRERN